MVDHRFPDMALSKLSPTPPVDGAMPASSSRLCPLAMFAPRHAVNLLRLKAFFSRRWQQMPAAHFMTVFGPYAARIDQILDRYDPAELAAAAASVTDSDDEIPLHPEELTA